MKVEKSDIKTDADDTIEILAQNRKDPQIDTTTGELSLNPTKCWRNIQFTKQHERFASCLCPDKYVVAYVA